MTFSPQRRFWNRLNYDEQTSLANLGWTSQSWDEKYQRPKLISRSLQERPVAGSADRGHPSRVPELRQVQRSGEPLLRRGRRGRQRRRGRRTWGRRIRRGEERGMMRESLRRPAPGSCNAWVAVLIAGRRLLFLNAFGAALLPGLPGVLLCNVFPLSSADKPVILGPFLRVSLFLVRACSDRLTLSSYICAKPGIALVPTAC